MRHKAVARTHDFIFELAVSTFSANARSDPTTAAALSYSEHLALVAVGRGTSRASDDHAAARFRARRRDRGGGLRVPHGALDYGARRRQSKIRSRASLKRGVRRVRLGRVFEGHTTNHCHSFEHPSLTAPTLTILSRPRLIIRSTSGRARTRSAGLRACRRLAS